jgi:hypothetical protein
LRLARLLLGLVGAGLRLLGLGLLGLPLRLLDRLRLVRRRAPAGAPP